ncbi:MAG: hypothetical protein HYR48_00930 [Gemmatimonadetes bacterium]|nr:hypothetical protein [Gemmatimonadota bacterium]
MRRAPAGANCLLSPFSIASVLSALCAGAGGVTRDELSRLIGAPDDAGALSSAIKALLQRVRSRTFEQASFDARAGRFTTVERDAFVLHTANALFVQSAFPVLKSYHETLHSDFDADTMALDFADAALAAARINDWVATNTNGKIKDLLQPETLSPLTRIVVANAVYFFAEWASQFSPERTGPAPFHLLPGGERSTVDVPMMRKTLHLQHYADRETGLAAVRIPYHALGMMVEQRVGDGDELASFLSRDLDGHRG